MQNQSDNEEIFADYDLTDSEMLQVSECSQKIGNDSEEVLSQ